MYNFTIKRLSYLSVFIVLFSAGVCIGSLSGMLISLLEKDAIGILGGAFLGVITGLLSGLTGLIYTFIFNCLAPITGGINIQLDQLPGKHTAISPSQDQQPPGASAP